MRLENGSLGYIGKKTKQGSYKGVSFYQLLNIITPKTINPTAIIF
jgi:hypothetical protein